MERGQKVAKWPNAFSEAKQEKKKPNLTYLASKRPIWQPCWEIKLAERKWSTGAWGFRKPTHPSISHPSISRSPVIPPSCLRGGYPTPSATQATVNRAFVSRNFFSSTRDDFVFPKTSSLRSTKETLPGRDVTPECCGLLRFLDVTFASFSRLAKRIAPAT